jgi:hypothetical protein
MSFKKTLCKIQNSVVQFPCIRPDDVDFYLDAHLSKHHPSGRRELSIRTSIYVQKLWTILGCIRPDVSTTHPDAFQCSISKNDFFPKHGYGKTAVTVRTTWLFRPDAILDKASRTEDVQPSERQTPWSGRSSLNMEIVCSRSTTVWTLGQHHPDATLFRKDFQANSESRLHSCPFEHPQLLSRCRLGKSYQTRFRFSVAYKWTPP